MQYSQAPQGFQSFNHFAVWKSLLFVSKMWFPNGFHRYHWGETSVISSLQWLSRQHCTTAIQWPTHPLGYNSLRMFSWILKQCSYFHRSASTSLVNLCSDLHKRSKFAALLTKHLDLQRIRPMLNLLVLKSQRFVAFKLPQVWGVTQRFRKPCGVRGWFHRGFAKNHWLFVAMSGLDSLQVC